MRVNADFNLRGGVYTSIVAQALARGIRLLNRPGVRIYVIVPLLINLLLFGAVLWVEQFPTAPGPAQAVKKDQEG